MGSLTFCSVQENCFLNLFKAIWTSYQILKKRGLDKISIFRKELLEKSGMTFFRGDCSFYIKNKLKSGILVNQ